LRKRRRGTFFQLQHVPHLDRQTNFVVENSTHLSRTVCDAAFEQYATRLSNDTGIFCNDHELQVHVLSHACGLRQGDVSREGGKFVNGHVMCEGAA
jgi:hypothetical protein